MRGSPNIHVVAETEQTENGNKNRTNRKWKQKQNKQKMESWEIFGKGITCLMPLLLLGPTGIHVEYFGEKEWDEKR